VLAALPGDQRVERAERSPSAGEVEDVGGGAFAAPVPGGEPAVLREPCWGLGVASGKPFVEQAERDTDAAGALVLSGDSDGEDGRGQAGVVVGDRLDAWLRSIADWSVGPRRGSGGEGPCSGT
jgi:hypothetical protein